MIRDTIWRTVRNSWEGAFVLVLATWLRLSTISDPFFITDQGRALLAGRQILTGNFLLWGPQTSVSGIALGPLYYYWTAAALFLSNYQVWGPTLSVALANILGVGLVWWWLRKFWGQTAALTGAGLLAVSGLASLQASIALEPGPLPLFAALWLWGVSQLILHPESRRKWWIFSWLIIGGAVQLNASAVILAAASVTIWWWRQPWSSQYSWIWKVGVITASAGTLLKVVLAGSTPAWYWWHSWQTFISPTHFVPALAWLLVLVAGVGAWLQRSRFDLPLTPEQKKLTWILGVWGSWSWLAFSLKTVTGDHALGLVFVWAAVLLGVCVQTLLPNKHQRGILGCIACILILQAVVTNRWLETFPQPRVSDHQAQLDTITQAADGKPYAFLYRGHLDVYDAADDHLQYLLWLRGTPPVVAARIQFDSHHPEYCETWIPKNQTPPAKTITLFAPFQEKTEISVGPPPNFLCR